MQIRERQEMLQWMGRAYYSLEKNGGSKEFFLRLLKELPDQIIEDFERSFEDLLTLFRQETKKDVRIEDRKTCAQEIVEYLKVFLKDELEQIKPLPQ